MEIKIQPIDPAKRQPKPADETKLVFGRIFSDHMFMMDWRAGQGWQDPRIEPYRNLALNPAAMVLHYGQGIFEGLKAYRWHDGSIRLFRPEKNWERFNRSARRMCMPEIEIADQFELRPGLGPAQRGLVALCAAHHDRE
jgi:branched-chain amino acid aminotransferase